MRQDLGEDVVRVRKIAREEGRKWSEPRVHRLPHVSNSHFISFRHRRICCVHEHVLKSFLHRRGALLPGLADKARDRRVLQHRLLQIRLEGFEVFVFGFSQNSYVFSKGTAVLFEESLCAL